MHFILHLEWFCASVAVHMLQQSIEMREGAAALVTRKWLLTSMEL